ncbi:MAG: DUF1553 domain-containing protein [Gemmataceae bacterium]
MPRTLFAACLPLIALTAATAGEPQGLEFFETKVRPLLVEQCQPCHGAQKQKGDLRLDSRPALLKGNDLGPVIVPGDPDKSRLIQAVRHSGEIKMPPKGKLPQSSIDVLTAWVKMGAPWPEGSVSLRVAPRGESGRKHWAFQPVRDPPLPVVSAGDWPATGVDYFILSALEGKKLTPSPAADKRTLLRRVTFDLTGLPPTAEEVASFEADQSPGAYARVVDRLLNSPRYGERWGRFWLDVARYADSKGYVFTEERRFPFAYTYRDYVVKAFNDDLPFDRFIIEQLAADRLPLGDDKHPLAAMGFLTLGRRFLNNVHDIIDDRIDVTCRGLMGLSVGCARCHDHKFDPIPQADYYSLYGVFASSVEPKEPPLLDRGTTGPEAEAFQQELAKLEAERAKFEKEHETELKGGNRKVREELKAIQKKIDKHFVTHPGSPPRGMVLNDTPSPVEPHVLLRGNPGNRGPAVPRQFLDVVAGENRKPFHDGSGRLELAKAIASPDNPLTARVFVNRIWAWHFGAGLVRTPSDFGTRSEPPSHPELLDWLATKFVASGWSVKNLQRLIVLSQTYRQSSLDRPELDRVDPENRLLGRMNRRRLEFEALRDSLLFVSGQLDETRGGLAVDLFKSPFSRRRTLYGFIDRQNLPGTLRTFDFASPDAHAPQRYATTVPQQALFLMNSPFVQEQAKALAKRCESGTPAQRVEQTYRLALGRQPTADEVALGMQFVTADNHSPQSVWEQYAQVLLLSNEFVFVD